MSLEYINVLDFSSSPPSPNIDPFSPPFPPTPSYNGSYHNSPYSVHSDLPLNSDLDQLALFDQDTAIRRIEYDPTDFDAPNSSSLLMYPDADYSYDQPHLSVPSAHGDTRPFDYSSPSSNGGGDSGPELDHPIRSRASSVSSTHHPPTTSPRLDVAHSFENMRFESPNWQNVNLPSDRPLSPSFKPQSPPQLRIPASPGPPAPFPQPPPIINAPAGDGGVTSGPQLHIVPATPISSGGVAQTQSFQNHSLRQQLHGNRPSNWSDLSMREESQTLAQLPPYHDQSHQATYRYSHDPNHQLLHPDPNNDLLYPGLPRARTKSDTSLQTPQWNPSMPSLDRDDSSALENPSTTLNIGDIQQSSSPSLQLPRHPASADSLNTTFHIGSSPVFPSNQFVYGGPSSSNLLSPHDSSLRRSKSDSGRPGHRISRSEDIRSINNNMLYPPSSQAEFIQRAQFLSPQEPAPPIRGGHHRRASSGSRLNGGVDRADGGGLWSSSSSTRPSPYPSPNASPRPNYDELPTLPPPTSRYHPPQDAGLGLGLDLHGSMVPDARGRPPVAKTEPISGPALVVSKPNVTTGRTANASHRRRKQEATFTCPVPKCGSTFTRSFNLRGHLRSHNEERPFQCPWPGCGKGFARQHDCKRHEQLHTNYRPYTCEGCHKQFARMDALNRHLRSEGGLECQKAHTASANNAGQSDWDSVESKKKQQQGHTIAGLKTEADSVWNNGIVV